MIINNLKYCKEAIRERNKIDVDFIVKVIVIVAAVVFLLIAIAKIGFTTYCAIYEQLNKYADAKLINDEIKELYKKGEQLGMRLIRNQDLERMEILYDDITYKMQQQVIQDAHTKLAQKICPTGTWVMLEEEHLPVRVNGHIGYECLTEEGIQFLCIDDGWHTLSKREYVLLKENASWLKNK